MLDKLFLQIQLQLVILMFKNFTSHVNAAICQVDAWNSNFLELSIHKLQEFCQDIILS